MTNYRFRKLIDKKQNEADKHNRMVYSGEKKGNCINGYDLIKEEYMKGKYETLTERQLELILSKCYGIGHGAICTSK